MCIGPVDRQKTYDDDDDDDEPTLVKQLLILLYPMQSLTLIIVNNYKGYSVLLIN